MVSLLDFINAKIEEEKQKDEGITYDEWCHIRSSGTPEEIEEAVERIEAQGGYDNLE